MVGDVFEREALHRLPMVGFENLGNKAGGSHEAYYLRSVRESKQSCPSQRSPRRSSPLFGAGGRGYLHE
jgi:hypothetical protein